MISRTRPRDLAPVEGSRAMRRRMRRARERRRVGTALAGPGLIVLSVLVVLRDFAFGGLMSHQHPDLLSTWLPVHCFLGKSLAAGHIPAWNPFVMAGVPFAADPQSGWMYLPAMALYWVLPCGAAMRWFIVLQPVLAGLGLYWFLRSERLSRAAATAGGLALALPIAGSYIGVSLPFAGSLAWTAMLLAAASRYLRSQTWPGRLGWAVLAALAWGQVAAAHLSHGLVVGTGALVFYGGARLLEELREGRTTSREAAALAGVLLVALPLVNLASLLPRLAYLPRTSLALGYPRLHELVARLSGRIPTPSKVPVRSRPIWPLALAATPGAYLGAATFGLAFGGWAGRRRTLALSFGLYGALCYLLSLRVVALALEPLVRSLPLGDFYLHEPDRLRFGTFLCIPILAALALEAWKDARSLRERALMLAPGVLLWGLLPPLFGVPRGTLLPLIGACFAALALAVSAVRPAAAVVVPAVLAVELVVNGLVGQTDRYALRGPSYERPVLSLAFPPLRKPTVPADAFLRPGPVARALQARDGARYTPLTPNLLYSSTGYLTLQWPRYWGLLANQQSMLFGIEEIGGYNPVQLRRYWTFVRAVDPKHIMYNAAFFKTLPPVARDLLQVGWTIRPRGVAPPGSRPVASEGRWVLYAVRSPPRASVVRSWRIVRSPREALLAVTRPGFDPRAELVLEQDPGLRPQPAGSDSDSAVYRRMGNQAARITVTASGPAVVLIRNSHDPNWRATVDGVPVPVLHADYLLQGVPVPPGRHTVILSYDDPAIGYGLLGSALSIAVLLWLAAVLRRRGHGGGNTPFHGAERRRPDPTL